MNDVQRVIKTIFGIFLLLTTTSILAAEPSDDSSPSTGSDSLNPVVLPGIVVSANRLPLSIREIPASVEIIDLTKNEKTAYTSTGDLAGIVPGVRSYPTDNVWGQSIVDVRGFYGAGQAQYLLVTLDGIPLNGISSGIVHWIGIDLMSVRRMEAIKGPVSALYGDFGFGGMLALYSGAGKDAHPTSVSLIGGSDDGYGGTLSLSRQVSDYSMFVTGSRKKNNGWRQHSQLETDNLLLNVSREFSRSSFASLVVSYVHADEEHPGALTQVELDKDRAGVGSDITGNPIRDYNETKRLLTGVSASLNVGRGIDLKPKAYINWSEVTSIVTLISPLQHDPEELYGGGEFSVHVKNQLLGRDFQSVAGVGIDYGRLKTNYTDISDPSAPLLLSKGEGTRWIASGFITGVLQASDRLSLTLGVRLDDVHTSFDFMEAAATGEPISLSQDELSLSPKAGCNLDITRDISWFASVSGGFKAPTLVHLYDSPPLYNPFAEQYILISNGDLKPLKGTSYETGLKIADSDGFYATVSGYVYDIRNEIDFDNATFSYVNIGKSRHAGVEVTVRKSIVGQLKTDLSFVYNSATFQNGDFEGNQLNGVPKYTYRASFSYDVTRKTHLNVQGSGLSQQYLDQANKERLDDIFTVSIAAGQTFSVFHISLTVDNLFDRAYNSDGYFDPLIGQFKYTPAPKRTFAVSLSSDF